MEALSFIFAHAQKRFKFHWTGHFAFPPNFYKNAEITTVVLWQTFPSDLVHCYFLMQIIYKLVSTPQNPVQYRTITSGMCQCHVYELVFSSNNAINCFSKMSRNYLEIYS